jgi:serine/threonine protein phosphatase PrpC
VLLKDKKDRLVNWEDEIVEACATDTGMRRANNQDSFAVVRASTRELWKLRGHLLMVADGMGAHAAGELASKMACDNIPHNYYKSKTGTSIETLTKAYREVGGQIHAKATANKDFHGMGTTCSTLILGPAGATIAHVGDSRVYRIRPGKIDQLSFDHSLVWELVRRNHITPEQAGRSVPRNVITRSLGPDPTVEVDIEGPIPVEQGDVFLLCSDGLSGPVTDDEIGVFAGNFHPEAAGRYLIQLANLRGGQDNITAVIARIGPWIEPGPDGSIPSQDLAADKKSGKGLFSGLLGGLKSRNAPPPVEEQIYQTEKCPIDLPFLGRIADVLRNAQAHGVDQAWSTDWAALATHRKKAEEYRQAGHLRAALGELGEAVDLLGLAACNFKKERAIGAS